MLAPPVREPPSPQEVRGQIGEVDGMLVEVERVLLVAAGIEGFRDQNLRGESWDMDALPGRGSDVAGRGSLGAA